MKAALMRYLLDAGTLCGFRIAVVKGEICLSEACFVPVIAVTEKKNRAFADISCLQRLTGKYNVRSSLSRRKMKRLVYQTVIGATLTACFSNPWDLFHIPIW